MLGETEEFSFEHSSQFIRRGQTKASGLTDGQSSISRPEGLKLAQMAITPAHSVVYSLFLWTMHVLQVAVKKI